MKSWGNSSEKALNALGNYVKRKKKYWNTSFFESSCNWKFLSPERVYKDLIKFIQGCADDFFESFPFVVRIVNCNVYHHANQSKLRRNIFARGGNQGFDCKWLVGFYQGNLAEILPNIMNTISLVPKLITISQLYGNLKVTISNRQSSSFSMYVTVMIILNYKLHVYLVD